jgi:hypothetical protein
MELIGVSRPARVADVGAVSQHEIGEVAKAFVGDMIEGSSWGLGARGVNVVARSGSGLGSRAAGVPGVCPARTCIAAVGGGRVCRGFRRSRYGRR